MAPDAVGKDEETHMGTARHIVQRLGSRIERVELSPCLEAEWECYRVVRAEGQIDVVFDHYVTHYLLNS